MSGAIFHLSRPGSISPTTFKSVTQIWWKLYCTLVQIRKKGSLQNFAYDNDKVDVSYRGMRKISNDITARNGIIAKKILQTEITGQMSTA